jgi:hypothetical protein
MEMDIDIISRNLKSALKRYSGGVSIVDYVVS